MRVFYYLDPERPCIIAMVFMTCNKVDFHLCLRLRTCKPKAMIYSYKKYKHTKNSLLCIGIILFKPKVIRWTKRWTMLCDGFQVSIALQLDLYNVSYMVFFPPYSDP